MNSRFHSADPKLRSATIIRPRARRPRPHSVASGLAERRYSGRVTNRPWFWRPRHTANNISTWGFPYIYRDSVRYVSARIRGVWFQVTPAWLKARGLLLSSSLGPTYVPQQVLWNAISDYLREFKSYGFQHTVPVGDSQVLQNLNVATLWWFGDKDGDGTIWPNGFGDLLIKWWRPGSLRDFLNWVHGVV
ncbi:hypothetical protein L209DRAFT_471060 [Thermothelomyces heterothallicus CBS 203.75]